MESELIIRNKRNMNNIKFENLLLFPKDNQENTDHTVPSRPSFQHIQESDLNSNEQIILPPYKIESGKELQERMVSAYEQYTQRESQSGYTVPRSYEDDDVCIEEILVGLGDASDGWYHPSLYERPYVRPRKQQYSDVSVPSQDDDISPSPPPSPYYASPYQIKLHKHFTRSKTQDTTPSYKKRKASPPLSPEDEPRLVESSDERELWYGDELRGGAAKKVKRDDRAISKKLESPGETVYDEGGICPKTSKPRQRKEYFYSKNAKTIFRWICCGSQAKDHPDV